MISAKYLFVGKMLVYVILAFSIVGCRNTEIGTIQGVAKIKKIKSSNRDFLIRFNIAEIFPENETLITSCFMAGHSGIINCFQDKLSTDNLKLNSLKGRILQSGYGGAWYVEPSGNDKAKLNLLFCIFVKNIPILISFDDVVKLNEPIEIFRFIPEEHKKTRLVSPDIIIKMKEKRPALKSERAESGGKP